VYKKQLTPYQGRFLRALFKPEINGDVDKALALSGISENKDARLVLLRWVDQHAFFREKFAEHLRAFRKVILDPALLGGLKKGLLLGSAQALKLYAGLNAKLDGRAVEPTDEELLDGLDDRTIYETAHREGFNLPEAFEKRFGDENPKV